MDKLRASKVCFVSIHILMHISGVRQYSENVAFYFLLCTLSPSWDIDFKGDVCVIELVNQLKYSSPPFNSSMSM